MQPKVKSYMTGGPISVEPEAAALAALDLMIDHGIRHLPVVDRTRRVVGVLSFDDLRAAFPVQVSPVRPLEPDARGGLRDIAVGEVMTYEPVTIREGDSLEAAAQLMVDRRIGCLPVVDDVGRLDGILSETDLLQALATALWAERRESGDDPPGEARSTIDLLRDERERIVAQAAAYERTEVDITEVERETPMDAAELGTDRMQAELTETFADLAARRLRAIDHALERAERGVADRCERCDGEIPEARLRALPSTTLCVRCAREEERAGR